MNREDLEDKIDAYEEFYKGMGYKTMYLVVTLKFENDEISVMFAEPDTDEEAPRSCD